MGHGEMKFPFKKTQEDASEDDFELDAEQLMAAVSERVSRFVLDAKFGNEKETVEALGLEMSDAAFDEEIELSEERIARLRGLTMLFHNYAALVAHSTAAALETALEESEDDTEGLEALGGLHVLIEYLVYTTTRATVAQLEDMGLITYNWEMDA